MNLIDDKVAISRQHLAYCGELMAKSFNSMNPCPVQ